MKDNGAHPGKGKLPTGYQEGVRTRLRLWWKKKVSEDPEKYRTYSALSRALGFARTTLIGWLKPLPPNQRSKKKPPAPSVNQVVELAQREGLSPNWLLLGIGPERIGSTIAGHQLGPDLRTYLVEELGRLFEKRLGKGQRVSDWIDARLPSTEKLLDNVVRRYLEVVEAAVKANEEHWRKRRRMELLARAARIQR
jgi:hypothetical protein